MTAKQLFDAATAILPLVPHGGQAIIAAQAVASMIADARETMNATSINAMMLDNQREALEAAVNAHANRTAAALGDAI